MSRHADLANAHEATGPYDSGRTTVSLVKAVAAASMIALMTIALNYVMGVATSEAADRTHLFDWLLSAIRRHPIASTAILMSGTVLAEVVRRLLGGRRRQSQAELAATADRLAFAVERQL